MGVSRGTALPRLERVLERSMMVCLLGLFRTERLAREMSAVTRVMEILRDTEGTSGLGEQQRGPHTPHHIHTQHLGWGAGWDPPSTPFLPPHPQGSCSSGERSPQQQEPWGSAEGPPQG